MGGVRSGVRAGGCVHRGLRMRVLDDAELIETKRAMSQLADIVVEYWASLKGRGCPEDLAHDLVRDWHSAVVGAEEESDSED